MGAKGKREETAAEQFSLTLHFNASKMASVWEVDNFAVRLVCDSIREVCLCAFT